MSSSAMGANNLPSPLTRFIGREAELARAAALLAEARMLTLTGPGGCGKTRLALRLAADHAANFTHGVWFIDLAPLAQGGFVLGEVAMTFNVKEPERGRTLAQALSRYFAPREVLLVLDNCEHVASAAADVTAGLLAAAPGVKVVATSREPLAVGGEVTWAVPPLSQADAVELFTDRARQARPDLTFREEDAAAVRSICWRLDGLPLAIELAAARTRAVAPVRIAAHLDNHFSILPTGPRTAPPRQATLRASFEWSYALLSDAERALLCQLAVFAGGFDVDAVLAVCRAATIDALAALVDRSLLTVDDQKGRGENRYRMLETIRQFAAEQLAEAGEGDRVRARHRDHYLALAETAEPNLVSWLARLAAEQDNLRAALAWSRDRAEADALARLTAALFPFWQQRNQWTEMRMWLEAAAACAGNASPDLRAQVRNLECFSAIFESSKALQKVPALANEALALARAAGNRREEATALFVLAWVAGIANGADAMRPYIEEALPLAREVGFGWGAVGCLSFFCALRSFQSNPDEPRRLIEEVVARAQSGGDRYSVRHAAVNAGFITAAQGRLAEGTDLLEKALAEGRQADHPYAVYNGLVGMAWVQMLQGDLAGAGAAASEGVQVARQYKENWAIEGAPMWLLGWTALAGGDPAQARHILEDAISDFRSSVVPQIAALPLVTLAEAQLALGAVDEAQTSLDEAVALAQAGAYTWLLGRAGLIRARLRARDGELEEAESLTHEALALQREAGDQLGLVDAVELLARLAAEQNSSIGAVRLWAAAESFRTALGYARFPIDRPAHESAFARARQAMDPDAFAAAWAEGANLSLEEAIAYSARGRGERRRPTTGWGSLTPTELEVVRLVGQHLSNPEIAARLFVSRATVKTHLIHVFGKLGIRSRSELVAEAIRRGIDRQPGLGRPAAQSGASSIGLDSRAE